MATVTFGDVVFLPPEKVSFSQSAAHQRVTLMEVGDITQLCPPGQQVVTFSGFFPQPGSYPFQSVSDPAQAAARLKEMLADKKPYSFVMSGVQLEIRMEATLEELELWQEGGDESICYRVKLQEYRDAEATVLEITESSTVRTEESQSPQTYTVKSGDTLWAIARQYLGDGSRYGEIAALSGIGNPNLIYPGQVLTLPEA
ncbi:MAG TPA: LysM peptidoglycan-binding domain-containing protein [Candidatus Faecivivens stercoripullorum]|uniref:LysM peptidoglycan-binding domain-containing protein n=1 Tax=Candidatus Faecivivens stercoripullorum TaxID=2840805 RepID=A0A9D1KSQ2_9FIRM|nr:LysM peptidoglycan-binding domain-containing protein [Candidatus Faecivivens stercoripullorum]